MRRAVDDGLSRPDLAEVYFDVAVYTADELLFRSAGGAMLSGWHGNWTAAAWPEAYATTPLWGRRNFQHPHNDDGAALVLSRPPAVEVDVSSLPVGTALTARVVTYANAYDRRINQEFPASTAYADLSERSPTGGAERVSTGLTVEGEPVLQLPPATPLPVCDTAPDPTAGELLFSADTFRISEAVGAGPQILGPAQVAAAAR